MNTDLINQLAGEKFDTYVKEFERVMEREYPNKDHDEALFRIGFLSGISSYQDSLIKKS